MAISKFPNTCLIFDAYTSDDFTLANFKTYKEGLAGICDVFFVLHGLPADAPGGIKDLVILDDEKIFDRQPSLKGRSRCVVPGNCDLKTTAAIEEIDTYEKYVSVEFDVICIDDVAETITRLIEITRDVDLGGSYIRGEALTPAWVWWKSIIPPEGLDYDRGDFLKAFLPVSIYSRKFVRIFRDAVTAGWQGHQEVLMPTIAKMNKMNILDINLKPHNFTSFPQFKVKKAESLDARKLPAFIHPVKNIDRYMEIPQSLKDRCELSNNLPVGISS